MKNLKAFAYLGVFFMSGLTISCSGDDGPTPPSPNPDVELKSEINDFVWKGLNEIYLWQQDVPNLADTKDDNKNDYYTFLNGYNTPEDIFDALLYQKGTVDKFSFLVDDYIELEKSFQGVSKSNGVDFRLGRISDSDDLFGFVRYIAKDSDASTKDISRGDMFLSVDGTRLNINNYLDLLFGESDTYTLGMADINNNTISLNGKEVTLTKSEFTEDPILINKIIPVSGGKVGYLMYNGFIANFDNALNDVFGDFKANGVTDLVLDLRYNPGGRVSTAIALASMISGRLTSEVFSREQWNNKYQAYFEANNPGVLVNHFVDKLADNTPINSLGLGRVFVLTTTGSASASEQVINNLDPYIDVIQIGTRTTGKFTASVTLYDSENFGRTGANSNHTYALQPLVNKSLNANGVTDFYDGLPPDHLMTYQTSSGETREGENILNLGALGDINEPFLQKALSLIDGSTAKTDFSPVLGFDYEKITDSKEHTLLKNNMFIDIGKYDIIRN